MASYESVKNDQDKIDRMYYTLKNLGEDVEYDNEKILDKFLTETRYFNANIFSTGRIANKVSEFDDVGKNLFAQSLQEIENMPNFGEGSAPKGSATVDYLLAGVSDPTNLLSAVAGAFTLGAGGAAGLAAKEAAKQGFKQHMKSKLKAVVSKPVMKSLVAEGTVAGAGGAYQNYKRQEVEKDVGLRKEIDPTDILFQGVLEGTLSPMAGVAANLLGSSVTGTVTRNKQSLYDAIPSLNNATAWLERNMMPTAALTNTQIRSVEREAGQSAALKTRATDLQEDFQKGIQGKDAQGNPLFSPEEISSETGLLNKALQRDEDSLNNIGMRSPELREKYNDFFNLVDEAYVRGGDSAVSKATKTTFASNPNYVRNVPEAYVLQKRAVNLDEFLKTNPSVLKDLRQEMLANPGNARWNEYANKYISNGKEVGSEKEIQKFVRDAVDNLYTPTRRLRKETGVFEKRLVETADSGDILQDQIDIFETKFKGKKTPAQIKKLAEAETKKIMSSQFTPTVKKILGYNSNPALRISETINGLVDTVARANTARDLAEDAIRRGVAVRLKDSDLALARQKLGGDVIPFLQSSRGAFGRDTSKGLEEAAMDIPSNAVGAELKNIFILKDEGKKINEIFNKDFFLSQQAEKDNLVGTAMRTYLGTQAFAKAGKTIYSPIALIRNAVGAAGYVTASGNFSGLLKATRLINKDNKQALLKEFEELGLKGSNIDLNQTLRRFGDVTETIDDGTFLQKLFTSGGLSLAGKKGQNLAKKARELYGDTDDRFKLLAYVNEKDKALKVFDAFSPEQQQAKLLDFQKKFNLPEGRATKQAFLKEEAASKTANMVPVYGRIPAILEKSRAFPIVGSFTAYPAERLRNTYQILRTGTDEMIEGFETGNTVLRDQGILRLGQWYATQGAVYTAAYGLSEMNGDSDTLDQMRSGLPEWQKDSALMLTGKTKDGMNKYINLGYLHPDQAMLEAIVPMMNKASRGEDVSKDLDDALLRAGSKLFGPYVTPSLAFEAASSLGNLVKGGINAAGGKDYDPSRDLFDIAKVLEPGYTKIARDMAQSAGAFEKFGELGSDAEKFMYPQRFGTSRPEAEDFIEVLTMNGLGFPGLKEEVFDPKKVLGFTLNTLNTNAKSNYNSFAKDLKDKLSDPRTGTTFEDVLEDYNDILQEQFAAQAASHKLFKDMEGLIGSGKLMKHLKSLGLSSVVPSNKKLPTVLRGISNPVSKARPKKFWLDLSRDLESKTGLNYNKSLAELRQEMINLENKYIGADLKLDPPEIEITN